MAPHSTFFVVWPAPSLTSILDPHDTFSSIYIPSPSHACFLFRCHFSLLHVIPETPSPTSLKFKSSKERLFNYTELATMTMSSITSQRKCCSFSTDHGIMLMPTSLILLLLSPALPLTAAQAGNTGPTDPYYNNFSPSMAIIVVILVAALFLMGFFSIYIRRCADNPNSSVRQLAGVAGRSRRQHRGLDPAVIESFPTLEYSVVKVHKIGKGALECAVCLNEFEESETLRLIPKCDHVFHPECIDEWLASHTTCPVCRTDLVPQPDESVHGVLPLNAETDIEAQRDAVEPPSELPNADVDREAAGPDVMYPNQTLNRNRTRGSRSSRTRRFPRSHSTGHSLVQPGENTDRFTLRLPSDVRNQILNRKFQRATSLVILPRESSSRRGYRTGGEGSNRGRFSRRLDRGFKSDRWVFTMAPPFLVRASSVRSPKVASTSTAGEETSADPIMPASAVDSAHPPV